MIEGSNKAYMGMLDRTSTTLVQSTLDNITFVTITPSLYQLKS
jgi:hypothetical protein